MAATFAVGGSCHPLDFSAGGIADTVAVGGSGLPLDFSAGGTAVC
jgi:hypothetical protein